MTASALRYSEIFLLKQRHRLFKRFAKVPVVFVSHLIEGFDDFPLGLDVEPGIAAAAALPFGGPAFVASVFCRLGGVNLGRRQSRGQHVSGASR